MTGGDIFTEITEDIADLNNTVVFKAGTQTITGDKTLSGTTTFTGNISANFNTITPTELGYIDGLTGNAQAQITARPMRSEVCLLDTTNQTINGVKSFSNPPECATNPTTTNQLTNKNYVDGKVPLTGAATISGVKTFTTLPESSVAPTTNNQLANKLYVDSHLSGSYVDLTTNQTVGGVKTFTSLPESSVAPTTNNQFANKLYVDSHLSGSYVDLTTNQTVGGVKTFTSLPASSVAPTTANQLVNKTYADTKVSLTGAETIAGIKTFSSLPESSVAPTTANQLVNKTYADTKATDSLVVKLAGTQTITGEKTFQNDIFTVDNAAGVDRIVVNGAATTLTNTTISLTDATPTTRYSQTSTLTTIRNATINLNDNTPITRFSQTSTTTTIRNTQINLQNNSGTNMITIGASEVNSNNQFGSYEYYTGLGGATTNPLVSFALTLYPQVYNTTASQLLLGYPDANNTKFNRTIRFPYSVRLVGWNVSGDTTAHGADTLRLRITTGTAGGGTSYYSLTTNVPANGLQSSSCVVNDNGSFYGFTSIGFINNTIIPAGTQVLFYENTGTTFVNEMMFVLFFQQIGAF